MQEARAPWNTCNGIYTIAEIGSNHDGDKQRALDLIARCADAGANAVKFQLFKAETLVTQGHPAYATLDRLHVPDAWLPDIAAACRDLNVDFSATPFDLASAKALAAQHPAFIKIASSDITYTSLLRCCAHTGLPLALSTGMSTFEETAHALAILRRAGAQEIALLHCVSMYPPEYHDMNLTVIPHMAQRFELPIGLSDHTPGSAMPVAAATLGAIIIEKHVTDDRSRPGPDHGYALEFPEFRAMVQDLRNVWHALGDGDKGPRNAESSIRVKARRGLYAAHDIAEGDLLDEESVTALRPTAEVNAEHIDTVLGKHAPCAIAAGTPLPASLLEEDA